MPATEHAPRSPIDVFEDRHALADIIKRGAVVKMRYMGRAFFGGGWLRTELHDGPRVSLPALLPWIRDTPGACEFLSFGNVLLEFILPCVLVVAARRDDVVSEESGERRVRGVFRGLVAATPSRRE